MPVSLFTAGVEPKDPNTPIWRFLEFWKFQDLMKGHMYFRRADLFEDESEGLPLDGYASIYGLNPFDLENIDKRNDALGFDSQVRQGYYINCWYRATDETAKMWHTYAKGNGVAIVSTYSVLKSVLNVLPVEDKAMLGQIRYGTKHLGEYPRRNLMVNISTKQVKYKGEKEVRAMLWLPDPTDGCNRHYDFENTPHPRPIYPTKNEPGVWRDLDIQRLVSQVIVSPFAEDGFLVEVEEAIAAGGYTFHARSSDMTSGAQLLLTADEVRKYL